MTEPSVKRKTGKKSVSKSIHALHKTLWNAYRRPDPFDLNNANLQAAPSVARPATRIAEPQATAAADPNVPAHAEALPATQMLPAMPPEQECEEMEEEAFLPAPPLLASENEGGGSPSVPAQQQQQQQQQQKLERSLEGGVASSPTERQGGLAQAPRVDDRSGSLASFVTLQQQQHSWVTAAFCGVFSSAAPSSEGAVIDSPLTDLPETWNVGFIPTAQNPTAAAALAAQNTRSCVSRGGNPSNFLPLELPAAAASPLPHHPPLPAAMNTAATPPAVVFAPPPQPPATGGTAAKILSPNRPQQPQRRMPRLLLMKGACEEQPTAMGAAPAAMEEGRTAAPPQPQPSVLADAITAAELLRREMGQILVAKESALRLLPLQLPPEPPLPPPPPFQLANPASGADDVSMSIGDVLMASGRSGKASGGFTQMGESELQQHSPAADPAAVREELPRVRVWTLGGTLAPAAAVQQQQRRHHEPGWLLQAALTPLMLAAAEAAAPAVRSDEPPSAVAHDGAVASAAAQGGEDCLCLPPLPAGAAPADAAAPPREGEPLRAPSSHLDPAFPPLALPPAKPGGESPQVSTAAAVAAAPPPPAAAAPAPASTTRPRSGAAPLQLSHYVEDATLLEAMLAEGAPEEVYPWQAECLSVDGGAALQDFRGLVFSAPTSAGKTLVAKVLLLRAMKAYPTRKTMLVLPYVALCKAMVAELDPLVACLGKEVKRAYGGDYTPGPLSPTAGVIVCTIENANSLVNRLIESGTPLHEELSCVVVDEVHMIRDRNRGYQLELLLNKVRYHAKVWKRESASGRVATAPPVSADLITPAPAAANTPAKHTSTSRTTRTTATGATDITGGAVQLPPIQIVGMSATIPNLPFVGKWLEASVYASTHRPIPLERFLKDGTTMYAPPLPGETELRVARTLPAANKRADPHHFAFLARETVVGGHSVLVFCGTKAGCEQEAKFLAVQLEPELGPLGGGAGGAGEQYGSSQGQCTRESIASALEGLQATKHNRLLADLIRRGVAYHHADLSSMERAWVDTAFRGGAARVLCSTSTLAQGVNLPARRVIFRNVFKGRNDQVLGVSEYHQMAGRAGRAGIDERGEAVLVWCPRDGVPKKELENLLRSTVVEDVTSCLASEQAMRRAMLELVAGECIGVDDFRNLTDSDRGTSASDVAIYINSTLLRAEDQASGSNIARPAATEALKSLCKGKLIFWSEDRHAFYPTKLGKAVLTSGLTPEQALAMHADIVRVRTNHDHTNELLNCYLCVPVHLDFPMNRGDYYLRLRHAIEYGLDGVSKEGVNKVAELMGMDYAFLSRHAHCYNAAIIKGFPEKERVCKRLFVACILFSLVQEKDVMSCVEAFGVERKVVSGLQEEASRFANKACAFCARLGWDTMESVFAKLSKRVWLGAKADIVSLTEIRGVTTATARLLFNAKLETPADVSVADAKIIANALARGRNRDTLETMESRLLTAKIVKEAAKKLLMQQGTALIEQAGGTTAATGLAGKRRSVAPHAGVAKKARPGAKDLAVAVKMTERVAEKRPEVERDDPAEGSEYDSEEEEAAGKRGKALKELAEKAAAAVEADAEPLIRGDTEGWEALVSFQAIAKEAPGVPKLLPGGLHMVTCAATLSALCATLKTAKRFGAQFLFAQGAANLTAAADAQHPKSKRAKLDSGSEKQRRAGDEAAEEGALVGIALGWGDGCSAFVPLHPLEAPHSRAAVTQLGPIFAGPGMHVAWFDLKTQAAHARWLLSQAPSGSDAPDCGAQGGGLPPGWVDARIAVWMAAPDSGEVMDVRMDPRSAVSRLLPSNATNRTHNPLPVEKLAAMMGKGAEGVPLGFDAELDAPVEVKKAPKRPPGMSHQARKACIKAESALKMFEGAMRRLEAFPQLECALREVEMPLVPILADMEAAGVGVSLFEIKHLLPLLRRRLKEIKAAVGNLVGREVNLGSNAEIGSLLWGQLKIQPPPGAKPTAGGRCRSTGKEILEQVETKHPVVPLIQEFRTLSHMLSVTQGLAEMALAALAKGDGRGDEVARIRGTFSHTSTATGRISMSEPELQCVPKSYEFVRRLTQPADAYDPATLTQGGTHVQEKASPRSFVVPLGAGRVMLSADFCQFEFRIMAHFCGDPKLRAMFQDGEQDPFRLLVTQWRGISADKVTPQLRDDTKQILYALMYGMGPSTLAKRLGVSENKASKQRDEFLRIFPGIRDWLAGTISDCRKTGSIATLAGRRRWLPGINATNDWERGAAERQAVNSVCQGSAADVAKRAMIAIRRRLKEAGLCSRATLVLQIHDELLFEVDSEFLPAVASLVAECMEGAGQMEVPLRVKMASGPSWGELKEYEDPRKAMAA